MSTEPKERPANTKFRQQLLPAWEPVNAPSYVSGCLFILAVLCISIGAAITVANDNQSEYEIRYDGCNVRRGNAFTFGSAGYKQGCSVVKNFTIASDMPGPVYLYYRLTGFYQNHRRYAKSLDSDQISGSPVPAGTASSYCDPLLVPGIYQGNTSVMVSEVSITGAGQAQKTAIGGRRYSDMQYSPCGLIAWSMFNDSVALFQYENDGGNKDSSSSSKKLLCDTAQFFRGNNSAKRSDMVCTKRGVVAWASDVEKFAAPAGLMDGTSENLHIWTGARNAYNEHSDFSSTDEYINNGWYAFEPGHAIPITTDEDFMVWMRTASLPSFRKLFRVFPHGLTAGSYGMQISEFFDSQQYTGEKYFVLSTMSWVGAKNLFFPAAYISVGSLCLVLSIAFIAINSMTADRTQHALDVVVDSRQ